MALEYAPYQSSTDALFGEDPWDILPEGWRWGAAAAAPLLLMPESLRLKMAIGGLFVVAIMAAVDFHTGTSHDTGRIALATVAVHVTAGFIRGLALTARDGLESMWDWLCEVKEGASGFELAWLTPELWFQKRRQLKSSLPLSASTPECKDGFMRMLEAAVREAARSPGRVKEMAHPESPFQDGRLPKSVFHIVAINLAGEARHFGFGTYVKDDSMGGLSLVTAHHVLVAARVYGEKIAFQRGTVRMDVTVQPVEMIPALDFVRMAVPPNMGALLGLQAAKAGRFSKQHPVTAYSLPVEGGDGTTYRMSRSMAYLAGGVCAVHYKLSTLPGSSGGPLFQGNTVVGYHTHAAKLNGSAYNFGYLYFRVPKGAKVKESSVDGDSNGYNVVDDIAGPHGRFVRYHLVDGVVEDIESYDHDDRDVALWDAKKEGGMVRWVEVDEADMDLSANYRARESGQSDVDLLMLGEGPGPAKAWRDRLAEDQETGSEGPGGENASSASTSPAIAVPPPESVHSVSTAEAEPTEKSKLDFQSPTAKSPLSGSQRAKGLERAEDSLLAILAAEDALLLAPPRLRGKIPPLPTEWGVSEVVKECLLLRKEKQVLELRLARATTVSGERVLTPSAAEVSLESSATTPPPSAQPASKAGKSSKNKKKRKPEAAVPPPTLEGLLEAPSVSFST